MFLTSRTSIQRIIYEPRCQHGHNRERGVTKRLSYHARCTGGIKMADHPLYSTWRSMIERCSRKSHDAYRWYGARGITVCPEWSHFWTFVLDMGERPAGKSLDRIDNDGPYAAWNCKWSTKKEQHRNCRGISLLTLNGVTLCLTDWAAQLGVSPSTVRRRINKVGFEKAMQLGGTSPRHMCRVTIEQRAAAIEAGGQQP